MTPFIVVVVHPKGGSGKTSTVISLATGLSKVCSLSLLDMDKAQKHTTLFVSNRKDKENKDLNLLHVKSKEEFDKLARSDRGGIILVDLGGYDSGLNRDILSYADIAITPMSDSDFDVAGALSFENVMNEIREVRDDLVSHILLIKLHHRDSKTREALVDQIKDKDAFNVLKSTISQRAAYKKTLYSGKSVDEILPGSLAAQEIENLVKEVKGLIDG